jgi:hypothetical protein
MKRWLSVRAPSAMGIGFGAGGSVKMNKNRLNSIGCKTAITTTATLLFTGTLSAAPAVASPVQIGTELTPAPVRSHAGGTVAVWTQAGEDRTRSSAVAKIGGVGQRGEEANGTRSVAPLAMDSGGRFGLCWVEQVYDPNTAQISGNIDVQYFTADGSVLSNIVTVGSFNYSPDIGTNSFGMDAAGNALVIGSGEVAAAGTSGNHKIYASAVAAP